MNMTKDNDKYIPDPWKEITQFKTELERVVEERHALVRENRILRFAHEEIANLQDRWPGWDYQDLYTVSRDTANNALETTKKLLT